MPTRKELNDDLRFYSRLTLDIILGPKGQGSVESILDEELEFRKPDDLPFNKYPMPEGQKLSQGSPDRDLMNNCIEVNAFEEPAYVDSTYARNVQRGAFGERTAAEFQCYLPPQNSIEEHLQVFFNTISMVNMSERVTMNKANAFYF